MRIIAGKFRGKQLLSPGDDSIRPTADRVRESVFNILASRVGPNFDGLRVLDLFAGTGALGLEALSRGAAHVIFVDTGAEARGLIRDHIEAFGAGGVTKLLRRDATALGDAGTMGPVDLVFLDPPYGKGWIDRLEPLLPGVLNEDAAIYVEAEQEIEALGDWHSVRHGKAGEVHYQLMRRETD